MISFKDMYRKCNTYEGMSTELDLCLMYALLDLQKRNKASGNLAEFGVFRGKSAALIKEFLEPNDKLTLVDVNKSFAQSFLDESTSSNIEFFEMPSENLLTDKTSKKILEPRKSSYRFIHSDGSHTFNNVYSDLNISNALLSEKGIVVIDDYTNPFYPQVPAAVFNYVYDNSLPRFFKKTKDPLTVFLIGHNKAFLCRKSQKPFYLKYAKRTLIEEVKKCQVDAVVAKTDQHHIFDAVVIKGRESGIIGDVYGKDLYGFYLTEDF